jgi:hypothetical protein
MSVENNIVTTTVSVINDKDGLGMEWSISGDIVTIEVLAEMENPVALTIRLNVDDFRLISKKLLM